MNMPQNSMINRPVNAMLFRMAGPISIGMLSTFLFQTVDTYFVGQLGSAELAALAFSSTAYLVFVSLFIGMSVGISAVVARSTGAGDASRSRGLSTLALIVVLGLSVALSIAARAMIGPMFSALGATGSVLPLIATYMSILYPSFPLLMLGIVGSGIVRAAGITGETEIVFAVAGIINLVFDYLLIFGIGPFPELGLAGAAVATALSFAFICLGVGIILLRHGLIGRPKTWMLAGLRDIGRSAIPAIAVQCLTPALGMITTFLLAGYGSNAVAAFGVAARIEALALVGIFAVGMAITPFVAQNFGAGEHDRIDEAIVFAGKSSIYLGTGIFIVLALLGPWIAGIFSDDPEVIRFVGLYFKIVAFSYGFQGLVNMTVAIFNGLQMPSAALRLMFMRTFAFMLPLLLLGSAMGLWWIFVAMSAGNILAALYAAKMMKASARKWNRPIANANPLRDILADLRHLIGR